MKKILPILLSAIALFIWNAISWMVLPFHGNNLNNIPTEAFSPDLTEVMPGSGVYHYPGLPSDARSMTEIQEMLKEGPRITLMVYEEGSFEMFEPMTFLKSILFNLITCTLLFLLFQRMKFSSIGEIVKWGIISGLLVSFAAEFSAMNWFKFPLSYTLTNSMDYVIGFIVVGLVQWAVGKKSLMAD